MILSALSTSFFITSSTSRCRIVSGCVSSPSAWSMLMNAERNDSKRLSWESMNSDVTLSLSCSFSSFELWAKMFSSAKRLYAEAIARDAAVNSSCTSGSVSSSTFENCVCRFVCTLLNLALMSSTNS